MYLESIKTEFIKEDEDQKSDASIYINLADLYWHKLENDTKALKMYKKAYKLEPNTLKCIENYASFLNITRNDLKKAKKLYKKLLKLKPNKSKYLKEYVEFLVNDLEDYSGAISIYKTLLKKKKKKQLYLDYIHALWMNDASTEELEKVYQKAFKKFPNSKGLLESYAIFQKDLGENDLFVTQTLKKIENNPKELKPILEYIRHLVEINDFENAKKYSEKALVDFGENLQLLRLYISLLTQLNENEKVEHYFKILLKETKDLPIDNVLYLNYLFRANAKTETILKLAKETIKQLETTAKYKIMADTLISQCKSISNAQSFKETEIVEENHDAEIAKFYDNYDKIIQETATIFSNGNRNKTMAFIKYVEQREPYNYNLLTFSASLKSALYGKESGLTYLQKKIKEDSKNLNIYKAIVHFYYITKDMGNAKDFLKQGLELFPKNEDLMEWQDFFNQNS